MNLNPADIRLLQDFIRRIRNFTVGPGLVMKNEPGGLYIGLAPKREYRPESVVLSASMPTGRVTAVASTSDAPPLKYTVELGRWEDSSLTTPGTWMAVGGTVTAYALQACMIPQLVGSYVTLMPRATDENDDDDAPIYSILGVSGTFLVYLTQVGGSDGDAATLASATWTYDVYIDQGMTVKIGTALSPLAPRLLPAETQTATQGLATIQPDGTVVLLEAYESFTGCAE